MTRTHMSLCACLVVCGLATVLATPAEARRNVITPAGENCVVVSASHHGFSPQSALQSSQKELDQAVFVLKAEMNWRRVDMTPQQVRPNPTLRSEVDPEIIIKPDIETDISYTQCWPGVIWPYVCTSGAKVCKQPYWPRRTQ